MSGLILVTEEINMLGMKLLSDNDYEIKMGTGISEETVMREIENCDAILTRNAVISEKIMRAGDRLKVIAMHGVGVDNIDVSAATRLGIQVVNAADSNKVSVAEYTIGLILGLAKHIPLYDRGLRGGNWNIRRTIGMDVEGKTLGIIGMGNIGSLVAKKAAMGLGMKVLGHKRNLASALPMEGVSYTDDMDAVLEASDFLSLHVPYTPGTEGLIGARELALLRPKAYLINTARGEVVDSRALYEALTHNRLAGAALDVFEGEIPDMSDPLLQMENVIVTPHTAAFTAQSIAKMALHAAMGVHEVLSGQEPTWPVNRLLYASSLCR
ncbi:MAG: hydroxyacid dehydrogenase [Acetanaerobacterium sp.]